MYGTSEAMVDVAWRGAGVRRDAVLVFGGAVALALAALALPWGWWLLGRSGPEA